MKKAYEAPLLEVETYELSANIASNCALVTDPGPGIDGHNQCDDYEGPWQQSTSYSLRPYDVNFYDDSNNCDCYTTGDDKVCWTS